MKKYVGYISVFLLVLILGGVLIRNSKAEHTEKTNEMYHNYLELTVEGETVKLDMESDTKYVEFRTLNSENELSILISGNDNFEVEFDGVSRTLGETFEYQFAKLDVEYVIPIVIKNTLNGEEKTFKLKTMPDFIPRYKTVGKASEGAYYITTYGEGKVSAALKVDSNGELLYYRVAEKHALFDFKKVNTKDGVRYLQFEQVITPYASKGFGTAGEYIVYDEKYHEINRLRMVASDKIIEDKWPVDQHDVLYVSDSEYYLMGYVDKFVNNIPNLLPSKKNATLVVANVIQGFKDGKLYFEWDSTDYPELYLESVEYNDYTNGTNTAADYAHLNSMDLDKTGNALLCSFRDLDSVLKIDLSSGDIIWKLGGLNDSFNLTEEQKLSRQHYARYNDNGSITVFDNGNAKGQTRIAEFWLDEDNLKVKDFKSYQIDGYWAVATGSTQRISSTEDIFVVGWGTRVGENLVHVPAMSEINFSTGNTVFALYFNDSALQTYRCVKY